MRDDERKVRGRGLKQFRSARGGPFDGQPVEAEPAQAVPLGPRRGQRIGERGRCERRVEGRVEGGRLGHPGECHQRRPDRLDRDRVVQRGEVGEPIELIEHVVVDERRGREPRPAVDDPVTDRLDRADRDPLDHEAFEEGLEVGLTSLGTGRVGAPFERRREQGIAAVSVEHARLERARARVQDEDAHPASNRAVRPAASART